jgi:hypothetical protein
VIQYDQAFANPSLFPNATRAYAYGPPSAGIRPDNDANNVARARAPIVVKPIDTSVIGPYGASDAGRLKIPTPTMLPTTRDVAPTRVRRSDVRAAGEAAVAGVGSVSPAEEELLARASKSEPVDRPRTPDVRGVRDRNGRTVRLFLSMCSSASARVRDL